MRYIWIGLLLGIGIIPGQVISALIFHWIMKKRIKPRVIELVAKEKKDV